MRRGGCKGNVYTRNSATCNYIWHSSLTEVRHFVEWMDGNSRVGKVLCIAHTGAPPQIPNLDCLR
jgi:hypothetical protein